MYLGFFYFIEFVGLLYILICEYVIKLVLIVVFRLFLLFLNLILFFMGFLVINIIFMVVLFEVRVRCICVGLL